MISLPKINGAAGMVLRGLGAIITGPGKIDGIKINLEHVKGDVDALTVLVMDVRADIRETKGYIKGHVEGHPHPDRL